MQQYNLRAATVQAIQFKGKADADGTFIGLPTRTDFVGTISKVPVTVVLVPGAGPAWPNDWIVLGQGYSVLNNDDFNRMYVSSGSPSLKAQETPNTTNVPVSTPPLSVVSPSGV